MQIAKIYLVMLLAVGVVLFPVSGVFAQDEGGIPSWIKTVKFKGDLRLRYQYDENDDDTDARHRERVRLRLGGEFKPHEMVKIVARVATGGMDPRSTNQTFQDNFSTKGFQLDQAYAEILLPSTMVDELKLKVGKFAGNKSFFCPSDLLWDTDLTFEGQSIYVAKKTADNFALFLNTGFYVLDEIGGDDGDPLMWLIQPGFKLKFNKDLELKFGLTTYMFNNVKGNVLDNTSGTNTMVGGDLEYDYDSINPVLTLTHGLGDKKIALIVDYVNNLDSDADDRDGYLFGIKYGHKKVKKPGTWDVGVNWRHLEMDAFVDAFPDADSYTGDTDIEGLEITGKIAVLECMTIAVDYYNMDTIERAGNAENIFQLDCIIKF